MGSTSPNQQLGFMLAILSAFGFSFKAIFVKLAYLSAPVDAVTLLSLRMVFSLPLFLLIGFASLRKGVQLNARDWGLLALLGLAGYYGASILDFMGLAYISAGLERVILFTYPTLTLLICVLFLDKPFSRRLGIALPVCYLGMALVFFNDIQVADDRGSLWLGAALVFGSALLYAFYNAFSEISIKRAGAMRFSVLALLVSILAAQLHFFSVNPAATLIQPLPVYLYCAAMALFSTVMPIFLQSSAIQHIGAAKTALIGMLGPILTIFFGWLLLAEPFTLQQLAGTLLVLFGVYLARRA